MFVDGGIVEWSTVVAMGIVLAAVGVGTWITSWAYGFKVASLDGEIVRLRLLLREAEDNAKRAKQAGDGVVGAERRIGAATEGGVGPGGDPVGGLRGLLHAGAPAPQPPHAPPGSTG